MVLTKKPELGAMRKVGLVRTYQGQWIGHLSEARELLKSVEGRIN